MLHEKQKYCFGQQNKKQTLAQHNDVDDDDGHDGTLTTFRRNKYIVVRMSVRLLLLRLVLYGPVPNSACVCAIVWLVLCFDQPPHITTTQAWPGATPFAQPRWWYTFLFRHIRMMGTL